MHTCASSNMLSAAVLGALCAALCSGVSSPWRAVSRPLWTAGCGGDVLGERGEDVCRGGIYMHGYNSNKVRRGECTGDSSQPSSTPSDLNSDLALPPFHANKASPITHVPPNKRDTPVTHPAEPPHCDASNLIVTSLSRTLSFANSGPHANVNHRAEQRP